MLMTLEDFVKKYPKPQKCPMTNEDWCDGLSYCWGYATDIDNGIVWDEGKYCPCEFFTKRSSKAK